MGFLEGLAKVALGVIKVLNEQQSKFDAAQAKLERQGIDDWDEDEIEWRRKHATFHEEAVINMKLREKNNK